MSLLTHPSPMFCWCNDAPSGVSGRQSAAHAPKAWLYTIERYMSQKGQPCKWKYIWTLIFRGHSLVFRGVLVEKLRFFLKENADRYGDTRHLIDLYWYFLKFRWQNWFGKISYNIIYMRLYHIYQFIIYTSIYSNISLDELKMGATTKIW